jgi:sec-independent protein translocase protein TatA
MGELSPWHWAIVILVLVVLFGARRLPDAARSLGRSARILKSELRADSETPSDVAPPAAQPTPPSAQAVSTPGVSTPAGSTPEGTDSSVTTSHTTPRQN